MLQILLVLPMLLGNVRIKREIKIAANTTSQKNILFAFLITTFSPM